jgi:formate dehydrogenase beta subunit
MEVVDELAKILGCPNGYAERKTALVGCYGVARMAQRFYYSGLQDCRAVALFYGGPDNCDIGCLGKGSCVSACPFNAIRMRVDGLPEIDPSKCRGCGRCAEICPKGVITLAGMTERIFHLNKTSECLAPCRQKCPAQVNVPLFIRHLLKKDLSAALLTIKERHPFPLSVGRTCPHPCENICRRNLADQGVAINHLARYLGEWERNSGKRIPVPCAPDTGRHVAIVGGGPAGLACAYFLRRAGHRPAIFEARHQLGGMLRYGIPEYRLPKTIVDWEIEGILELGVAVCSQGEFGQDFTLKDLEENGFEAVFLGFGAWITPDLGIPGETATGVYGGLDFLSKVRTLFTDLTKKPVVVVGESNTAMDCARSCIRLGAESVTVICPCDRKDMSARNRDVNRALEEGVRITFNKRPVRILSNAMGCATGLVYAPAPMMCVAEEPGKPARTFNEQGSHALLPAGLIIAASERKPDLTCLFDGKHATYCFKKTKNGTLGADRFTQMAAAPNIFAAGDLHTGRATVISAVAGGRLAARAIHHLLMHGTIPLPDTIQRKINPKSILRNVRLPETRARISIDELPVALRCRSFVEEVIATIGFEQAQTEAKRCLQCGTYGYDN